MQIQTIGAASTMSSIHLLELVNRARLDELDGEHYESFVVQNPAWVSE